MTHTETLRLALEALEKLWNIIDDIDTYSDMAKADEKLYRSLVERRQRQRFEETGISTDGYELHGGAITAIKAALEAKDEPVAWMRTSGTGSPVVTEALLVEMPEMRWNFQQPLYTTPQQQEAKDEPVAWVDERAIAWLAEHPNRNVTTKLELQKSFERPMPLYTNPTQRKPLTDEEIGEVAIKSQDGISPHDDTLRFARAIEAAHGIKGEA